jgi:hypothetical protein
MNTVAEGCFLSGGMDKFVSNADFLDALAKSGLYGVFGADMRVAGHPNLLGWIQIDRPDKVLSRPRAEWKKILPCSELILKERTKDPNFPAPPQVIVSTAYEWMKKVGKSRPVFLTLGASILKDEGPLEPAVKQKEYPEYLKSCDVAGCAVHPITAGHGAGRLDAVAKGVATLREMAGPGKPVFAWIETGAAAPPPAARRGRSTTASAPASAAAPAHLSPAQMRAEAWMAIIGGATALGFRGFEGYADVKVDGETAAELKRLNGQIARLAPALLAGPAKAKVEIEMEGRLPCHVKATENEGAVYVFAQNLDLGADKAPDAKPRGGKATIKVAGLKAGTKIEVVDENRSITAGEGQFTDEFAPLAEHVYKLAAP